MKKWVTLGLLIFFFGLALFLRVGLPYNQVFAGNWVRFDTPDAYFFLRQIDGLIHNFPHHLTFDPYLNYPNGASFGGPNLWVYLIGSAAWLLGLGSPSQHLVDSISAYAPAILAALTVFPVYFIGKNLFNSWAGLVAAALMAVLPGEWLGRTVLGATDRDALEVLLTALSMLFFILAIKTAREKQITIQSLRKPQWSVIARPLIYSLLAGLSIGLFLLTWRGAFLVVLIILLYLLIQHVIDHWKHRSQDYLGFVGFVTLLAALIIFSISSPAQIFLIALAASLVSVLMLTGLGRWLAGRKTRLIYYPVSLICIGLVALGLLVLVSPATFKSLMGQFSVFFPTSEEKTILEMQPILFPFGTFSFTPVWVNYTLGAFLSLISLGVIIYLAIKRKADDTLILIVWSLIMLVGTLVLRRLAILYAINVALLTGYLGGRILEFTGLREQTTSEKNEIQEVSASRKPQNRSRAKRDNKRKNQASGSLAGSRIYSVAAGIILVFLVGILPNFFYISPAVAVAGNPAFSPSNAWHESLVWLKDNTPEPLGDAGAYYDSFQPPFSYPTTAYRVAAWWDFGYWIARIGHRLPNSDPGGGARDSVARLFLAQDEATADALASQLNSKYLMIDDSTITSKLGGVVTYAGLNVEQFTEVYYRQVTGTENLTPIRLYYPEYYQSLATRLFVFDGKKVTPSGSTVISYEERISREGVRYKQILDTRSFPTFEEANAYIAKQKTGRYRIVGSDPAQSPVPLAELSHYKLIHASDNNGLAIQNGQSAVDLTGQVKIFEFSK